VVVSRGCWRSSASFDYGVHFARKSATASRRVLARAQCHRDRAASASRPPTTSMFGIFSSCALRICLHSRATVDRRDAGVAEDVGDLVGILGC